MSGEQREPPENIPNDLKSFEAKFASLRPVASRIDRDRLMYEAGGAAALIPATVRRPRLKQWLWPCASAALLIVAATLGAALVVQRRSPERIVYVSPPATVSPHPPAASAPRPADGMMNAEATTGSRLSEQSNFALRQRALRFGADAIGFSGNADPGRSTPETCNRSLLHQMLGT